MRLAFFGTPAIAARVLADCLEAADFDVVCSVTQPDRIAGRGNRLMESPVKQLAASRNIPVFTPEKPGKDTGFVEALRSYEPDFLVVIAYGAILPRAILDIPRLLPINIHGSVLPAYRGASPIQSALDDGEIETGITIMAMSEGMDEGDMLCVKKIPIVRDETAGTLFEKMGELAGPTLLATLRDYSRGLIAPIPQNHALATYTRKVGKHDGFLDFREDARRLYDRYRAVSPSPGAWGIWQGKQLRFETLSYSPETLVCPPGTIMDDTGIIRIACGEGNLILERMRIE